MKACRLRRLRRYGLRIKKALTDYTDYTDKRFCIRMKARRLRRYV